MRKQAFTLAEILITLGIIGIVAALTMGTIIPRLEKVKTEAKLKKFYNTIAQATDRAMVVHGDWSTWDYTLNSWDFYEKYYKDQLQVIRVACKYSNSDFFECKPSDFNYIEPVLFFKDGTCAQLTRAIGSSNYNEISGWWWNIRTNCYKGKAIEGRNYFKMGLYNFKNMRFRCNSIPSHCGFPGDRFYVADSQTGTYDSDPSRLSQICRPNHSEVWDEYYCYYKFVVNGMKLGDDFYTRK